jgi:hypothetical protein
MNYANKLGYGIAILIISLNIVAITYNFGINQPIGVVAGKVIIPAHNEEGFMILSNPNGTYYNFPTNTPYMQSYYVLVQNKTKMTRFKVSEQEFNQLQNGQSFYQTQIQED